MSAPKPGTPLQLGVHRNVPVEWARRINPAELEWDSLPDDSQVATFSVRSPGARAIRLAIQFHGLPAGAEIRYYSPDSPETFFGPFDRKLTMSDPGRVRGSQPFWSPLVAGEVIEVEIFVPDKESTGEVWISLEEVAHVLRSPFDAGFYKDTGDSGGCNKDLACSKKWERAGDSVALVIFERSSGVFACTGQLLTDTDPETLKWNFLTARHCINKKKVARSAIFLWFYQRAKCRSAPPSSIIQTAGGAKLKFKSPKVGTKNSTDHSLLRLRRDPPSGIALAGWSPDHFSTIVGKKVKGIHHPASDLKKSAREPCFQPGMFKGTSSSSVRPGYRTT